MPIKIGMGQGQDTDPLQAIQAAVQEAKLNFHKERIDLAMAFSTIEFANSDTLNTLAELLDSPNLVGASSLGIISNQGILKHGIIVVLLNFGEGIYFNAACVKDVTAKSPLSAGEELGEKLLYGFKNIRRDLGVIFSDGLIRDGSGMLSGLQERLGTSFPLAGASASDNLALKKTYLYFGNELLNDAACGLLLGGKLNFGLGIKHGWKPLGKPRYVTKSAGNIVHEIDNAPAAKVYEEYFSSNLSRLRKELKHISIFYPLGVYLAQDEEYLLRNILSIEDDGSLILQGNIPQGSSIRLMIGTKESCLAATHQALDEVKKGFNIKTINFVLVFDSISRYMLLGRRAGEELEIIKDKLGPQTPIVGIYTYGEQAPLKAINYQGKAYFHNQTITILGIGS